MKKLLISLIVFAIVIISANAEDSFDRLSKVQDPTAYWSRMETLLYRANKKYPSSSYRYQYHITNMEYLDCSYFKKVDCTKATFCRCWQCRNYRNGKKVW